MQCAIWSADGMECLELCRIWNRRVKQIRIVIKRMNMGTVEAVP